MTSFINQSDTVVPPTPGDDGAAPNSNNSNQPVVFELNGRKFTQEDLAKKLTHADSTIDELKRKLAELEVTASKTLTAEELLARLKAPDTPAQPAQATQSQTLTADDVANIVQTTIANATTKQQQESNWKSVTAALTATYGEKTDEVVRKIAVENEWSIEEAAKFARTNPKVFLKLFPEVNAPRNPKPSAFSGATQTSAPFNDNGNTSVVDVKGYMKARNNKEKVANYEAAMERFLAQQRMI